MLRYVLLLILKDTLTLHLARETIHLQEIDSLLPAE